MPVPVAPQSFCKYTSSLNGHNQPIKFRRKDSKRVDYECELAFVVGRRARDVVRAKALDYVFGYTLINDVSARDHQFTEGQVGRAKGFDTFTPMGPCIVTADVIHALTLEPDGKIAGDVGRAVVTQQPRFANDFGSVTTRCLQGEHERVGDVVGPHGGAQLPGDDVTREVVQDG
jgi:hypothetical protein